MKKVILPLIVAAIVSFAFTEVYSQGWGNKFACNNGYGRGHNRGYGDMGGLGRLEKMKRDLNLTEDQVKAIFEINTKYREFYFENRGNSEKLTEIRAEHRKEIESILTDSQKKNFNLYGKRSGKFGRRGNCVYR
ncbi:MAG: hypothetical protein SVR08_12775 [Spirochaetota bacterium]|nr:hypothetical protein [Spirochaetota bacterium]